MSKLETKYADSKKRIEEVRKIINRHRYLYHVLNREEISAQALDSLKRELKLLEDAHPEFVTPDSPTQRVAGKPLEKFIKVTHKVRQWSLEDAFSEQEMQEWELRLKRLAPGAHIDYVGELKIDGLHIILTYEKGGFIAGATRGDGEVGEDVTQNLKTIEAIPLTLALPIDCVVEGEVFMARHVLEELNKERAKKGEQALANPRNAAAGAIRQLDPAIARERRLDCFVYELSWPEKNIPATQKEELEFLKKLGFKVNDRWQHLKNLNDIIRFWELCEKRRETEDYWIDGTVIKINRQDLQKRLGYTGKAPRFAIAFKFSPEETTTIIQDVIPSLGRTGKITPIALLKPVVIKGTTISRASLHNYDEIARLDARKGDTAIISKAGDIIPKVIKVLPELRQRDSKKISPPTRCPICGGPVKRAEGQVDYFCANPKCFSLQAKGIIHFFSKQGLDARGLGEKIILRLLDENLIKDIIDVFDLKVSDIAPLEGFGEKSAQNLISSIYGLKRVRLWRLLNALGIPHVGRQAALWLERWFVERFGAIRGPKDLADGWKTLTPQNFEEIAGIGPKASAQMAAFIREKKHQKFFADLAKRGMTFVLPQREKLPLTEKTFVFSGSLSSMTRSQAQEKVIALGASTGESVSKKTDYLVAGFEPGSKLDQAKKLGITILDEKQFLGLIKR